MYVNEFCYSGESAQIAEDMCINCTTVHLTETAAKVRDYISKVVATIGNVLEPCALIVLCIHLRTCTDITLLHY